MILDSWPGHLYLRNIYVLILIEDFQLIKISNYNPWPLHKQYLIHRKVTIHAASSPDEDPSEREEGG